jgi:hypothetical protein
VNRRGIRKLYGNLRNQRFPDAEKISLFDIFRGRIFNQRATGADKLDSLSIFLAGFLNDRLSKRAAPTYTVSINECGILVGVENLSTLSPESNNISTIYDMQPSEQIGFTSCLLDKIGAL